MAMNYTTQQLQGGPVYSYKTRIGNWNEDLELQAIRQTDYEAKKSSSQLPFAKTKNNYDLNNQKVSWSHSADGTLRSGDSLMLKNKKTDGWLAMNTADRLPGVDERYNLTTIAETPGPVARAMFVVTRVEAQDMFGSDDIIRYGQKIKLQACSQAFKKPLFLSSAHRSTSAYSPVSRLQEASMAARDAPQGHWIVDVVDPNERMERQGEPVNARDPVLLRHCFTGSYLASDKVRYQTDIGGEFEVSTHSFSALNRSQNLALEEKGTITTDVPTKFQCDQNVFFFVDAPNATYSVPTEELSAFRVEDLVAEVKAKLLQRSAGGLKGIARIFKAMDDNGNGQLDIDDFRWGFIDYGFNMTKEEAQQLLTHFDTDKNGTISFNEFLRAIKDPMNDARRKLVRAAYEKLDVNKDGQVTLRDIAQIYDASQHPDVKQGKKHPDEVFADFMSQWDCQNADGIVTFDEFCEYYESVSVSVDRDDVFELMMTNAWKL